MTSNAGAVLHALQQLAHGDEVAATAPAIAAASGLTIKAVRRAQAELCEHGHLAFTGRRTPHGTAIFKLTPGPSAEAAQPEDGGPPGPYGAMGDPPESSEASERDAAGAAPAAADTAEQEPSAAELEALEAHHYQQAIGQLDRLYTGAGDNDGIGPPDHGEGPCADCGHIAQQRWKIGTLVTCRTCRTSRHRAAQKLDQPITRPDSPAAEPRPARTIETLLHARAAIADDLTTPTTNGTSGNGNGHHDPDDYDLLEEAPY